MKRNPQPFIYLYTLTAPFRSVIYGAAKVLSTPCSQVNDHNWPYLQGNWLQYAMVALAGDMADEKDGEWNVINANEDKW